MSMLSFIIWLKTNSAKKKYKSARLGTLLPVDHVNVSADTKAGAEEWLARGETRSTPFSIIMVLDQLQLCIKTYSVTYCKMTLTA